VGSVLAFMPVFPVAFPLAKLFGPPFIGRLEGCDRLVLLVLVSILWLRNRIKLKAPDWFLLACFGVAVLRLAFGGILVNFLADFSFLIPYAAGRVFALAADQERVWATRAVWIVAILSVLGMSEVFVFGPGPRALLYSTFQSAFTSDGTLSGAFYVSSYGGLRESATMISPPYFGLLCMVALIIWWVYRRSLVPAIMIAAGLILTITRGAWLSTAGAIAVLAVVMGQKKRFLRYAAPALVLAVASLFLLGLGDYFSTTIAREDPSAEAHVERVREGWEYVSTHPFGAGPGNYERAAGSKRDMSSTSDAPFIENTYLGFAAAYGVLGCFCFLGFLLTALRESSRLQTQLGYLAIGILVGFGAAMVAAPLLVEFSLACWIWFPIGMAVRSSTAPRMQQLSHSGSQVGLSGIPSI
jgi:O-antigen ligase